jgi:dTDP-glucose 4,6-dehydratase
VEGFVAAAESSGALGRTINVGSNQEITIGDLAQRIIQLVGRDCRVVLDEQRLRPKRSEVRRLLADNRQAKELLGWQPVHSLEGGLTKTIRWISAHLDLYRPGEYRV